MVERDGANPKVEQIIDQYRRVAGAWDEMFRQISQKTNWEIWKQDGVGSCGIGKEVSETGLEGLARDSLIELREEINASNKLGRVKGQMTCPYHRASYGCVVGDLKAPICISHIENKDEVWELFGLNHYDFAMEVHEVARRILFARGVDLEKVRPEENEDFVNETVARINEMTERARNLQVDESQRIKFISGFSDYS